MPIPPRPSSATTRYLSSTIGSLSVTCYARDGMEPGTLLAGRYRIQGVLASGGMGVVYSARQLPLNNPVALKVLRREHLKHGPFLDRLRREARIAASLKHPNI